MPLNNRLTNPGRPLTSEFFGGESDTIREIPPEFRAACDLTVVEIPLPWDQPLIPLSDPVLASKAEMKLTSERIRRTTYKQVGPVALHEVYTGRDKQLGNRTRTMRFQGDAIASPGPFRSVDTKDLGNKHFIETIEDDGTLFSGATSTKEIADVLPEIFKANIPSYEYATNLTGVITVPQILGTGEFYRSETQTDVFNMRRTTKTRTPVGGLPITFQEYKLTPEQQVETIFNTLDNGLQTINPIAIMVEAEVKNLGNGQSVARIGYVPSVFNHIRYELMLPDVIPAEFRTNIPTTKVEQTIAGTATMPVATAGDLALIDEQVTALTHRTSESTRSSVTLPQLLIDQEVTEQFGGGTLWNYRTLDVTGNLFADTGLFVVSSVVKRLGNGMDLKETRQLHDTPWPTLTSLIWDDEMQVFRQEDEQVVATTYTPTSGSNFIESVKAIDKWRSKRIRTTRNPTATGPGSAIITYDYRPFQFPGTFDYARNIAYDHREGYRRASAQLVKMTVKTWWQVSVGPPSIGVDEIIVDTVNVPIYTAGSTTEGQTYANVLHDDFTNTLGAHYPATTPSFEEYYFGTPSGTSGYTALVLANPGSGYVVGNVVSYSGVSATVTSTGVGGSITGLSSTPISGRVIGSSNGPIGSLTGGLGTGGQAYVLSATIQNYAGGTAWVGNSKIIAAKVSMTDVPNLWKCQTTSVVMR
jgi:hypothetical protein